MLTKACNRSNPYLFFLLKALTTCTFLNLLKIRYLLIVLSSPISTHYSHVLNPSKVPAARIFLNLVKNMGFTQLLKVSNFYCFIFPHNFYNPFPTQIHYLLLFAVVQTSFNTFTLLINSEQ